MSDIREKLSKCNCGGSASLNVAIDGRYRFHVVCLSCGFRNEGSAFENDEYNIESWNKTVAPWANKITALQEENERLRGELSRFKPAGHWYQHEDTGVMGSVDEWQVENGFFNINPRLIDCGIVYKKEQDHG